MDSFGNSVLVNANAGHVHKVIIRNRQFLINLICIVGGGIQCALGTAATNGLLCQPRVIMMIEKSTELLAGETEVLGENLPQCRFVHHKTHMLPGREPGPPRWETSD
jgi:hypothetical protein